MRTDDTARRLGAALDELEGEVVEQVRRLAASRQSRGRALARLLDDVGGDLGPYLVAAAVGRDVFGGGRERRELATEIGQVIGRQSGGRWFGEGGTTFQRALGNYSTGSYLGGLVGGGSEQAGRYGGLGAILGYAVGGAAGGYIGSLLGGIFGGRRDRQAEERARLERLWHNTPEGFEIEAYLYRLGAATRPAQAVQITLQPGAVQIKGQDAEAGARAGEALIGQLGRAVELAQAASRAVGW